MRWLASEILPASQILNKDEVKVEVPTDYHTAEWFKLPLNH